MLRSLSFLSWMLVPLVAGLVAASPVLADRAEHVERAGKEIPKTVEHPGAETPLRLNGTGVMRRYFQDIYVAALYLPEREQEAQAILGADDQVRRLELHFVFRRVGGDRFISEFESGMEESLSGERLEVMRTAFETYRDAFETDVVDGDVITYDYHPGEGTRILLNGDEVAHIEDPLYFEALLAMWIGEDAVDGDIRDGLLGVDG